MDQAEIALHALEAMEAGSYTRRTFDEIGAIKRSRREIDDEWAWSLVEFRSIAHERGAPEEIL